MDMILARRTVSFIGGILSATLGWCAVLTPQTGPTDLNARVAEMGGPLAVDIDHGRRILDFGRAVPVADLRAFADAP